MRILFTILTTFIVISIAFILCACKISGQISIEEE